jgi:Cys-rich repeat protein
VDGDCSIANVAAGAIVSRDSPPNCWDTICDGRGGEMRVVDLANVPAPASPCMRTSCAPSGATMTVLAVAGAACGTTAAPQLCDGAGRCVQCLASTDCPEGQSCAGGTCIPGSCSDGVKNGQETDVDCGGGTCPPCAVTRDCVADRDCASLACDAWAPHRCLGSACLDHRRDGDESDIDCGGSCVKCPDHHFCKTGGDCASGICDLPRGSICLPSACRNGVRDGNETDVDCGGGVCDSCAVGQQCLSTLDCGTGACDVVSHLCVADHCADHAQDGDETDVDCGGASPACARCATNQRCNSASDCWDGHACVGVAPRLCK